MNLLGKIRAVFYTLCFTISVTVLLIILFFKSTARKSRQIWAIFQRLSIGYKIKLEGEFDETAQLLIINHQSMLDILILEELHKKDLCWIAKKELLKMPLIGGCIKYAKMISVDRDNPRELVKIVNLAKERTSQGRVIAMFPEGTRGRGEKLLKFQSGAKVITEKLKLKVQPIVITNTSKIMDTKKFMIRPDYVNVICLPLVDTSKPEWFEDVRTKMQEVLDAKLKPTLA